MTKLRVEFRDAVRDLPLSAPEFPAVNHASLPEVIG
jgi:hypothetical protein